MEPLQKCIDHTVFPVEHQLPQAAVYYRRNSPGYDDNRAKQPYPGKFLVQQQRDQQAENRFDCSRGNRKIKRPSEIIPKGFGGKCFDIKTESRKFSLMGRKRVDIDETVDQSCHDRDNNHAENHNHRRSDQRCGISFLLIS